MMTTNAKMDLPKGITAKDLTPIPYKSYTKETTGVDWNDRTFSLWYITSFGWVIPTLGISKGRGGFANRTYAVKVSDGGTCRVGQGPHVLKQVTVHVRTSRLKDLQKFLDLRTSGAGRAGEIRDRISSRRAEGQLHRNAGHSSWRWGTL